MDGLVQLSGDPGALLQAGVLLSQPPPRLGAAVQLLGHTVEAPLQVADVVLAPDRHAPVRLPGGEGAVRGREALDALDQPASGEKAEGDAYGREHGDQRRAGQDALAHHDEHRPETLEDRHLNVDRSDDSPRLGPADRVAASATLPLPRLVREGDGVPPFRAAEMADCAVVLSPSGLDPGAYRSSYEEETTGRPGRRAGRR